MFQRKPRQPDMKFAANAFYPIAAMRLHGVRNDFAALNNSHTASLLAGGCSAEQARSAHWGGMSAMVQEPSLFRDHVQVFEAVADRQGINHVDVRDTELKLRSAAMLVLAQVLTDAPDDYERYLRHLGV